MAKTFAQLKLSAQRRADQETDPLVEDAELGAYVNDAVKELYLRLLSLQTDAYLKSTSPFTITSGNTAPLPADFFKSRGLDYLQGSRYVPVPIFNFRERGRYPLSHRVDSVVRINPPTQATGKTYVLWYWPTPTLLVNPTDTLDPIMDVYSEFVEVTAAIACVAKDQLAIDALLVAKNALIARIEREAEDRDSEPQQSAIVDDDYDPFYWAP